MVLDGLFVVQLIRKFNYPELREPNEALFKQNLNLSIVALDLLLLENQLPFCLLKMFANMVNFACSTGLDEDTFEKQALNFFSEIEPRPRMPFEKIFQSRFPLIPNNEHLLGLVHDNWIPRRPQEPEKRSYSLPFFEINQRPDAGKVKRRQWLGVGDWNFIKSATELWERGIKFKTCAWYDNICLFDIKFENGTLYIPTLIVDHDTDRIFRNLIAYEQFKHDVRSIVMDYARLMDSLINYAADVELLRNCGIIDNRLGSNKDVANMINRLNDYVYLSTDNFYYSDIFDKVNEHCNRCWNLWKVKLRQTYFQSPWDWILTSIAAATVLLILTTVQTIFAVLPYFRKGAT